MHACMHACMPWLPLPSLPCSSEMRNSSVKARTIELRHSMRVLDAYAAEGSEALDGRRFLNAGAYIGSIAALLSWYRAV